MPVRHLFILLGFLAALLPGFASAQEVTWQEVAQSLFIVTGTPVPYDSPLLTEDDLQNRRIVELKNPVYLKGEESNTPVLLMMVPYEPVLWNQPTIFFLRSFTMKEAAGEREIYGDVTWYHYEGMWPLDYGPRPRLYTDELAAEIKRLMAQNEHYWEIGAVYIPADNDPLLALIKQDLREIAKPIDFSKGAFAEEIEPHSLAIRRLLYRGEDIVPRLVSLLESNEPFPAGSIIVDPTHFFQTDVGPPPTAHTMAEAIDVLLGYWSGFIFGHERSVQIPEFTLGLWQTYLGYQLAGIDPTLPGNIDWQKLAEGTPYIIEGTLTLSEDPLDRDINHPYSSMWGTLSNPRFLKGEDQGGPYRIYLDEHWIQRAKNIEGKVVVFSDGSRPAAEDHQRVYDLVYAQGRSQIVRSADFDSRRLDTLLATDARLRAVDEPITIDPADPYWAKLRTSLESAASASEKDEINAAVQRVIEYGEPAVPYLIAILGDDEPWPYGKVFAFLKEPWRGDSPTFGGWKWEHLAAGFLRLIAEQPLSGNPFGSFQEGASLRDHWNTYLANRLSTPEGRLALSHDPAVSKAEALRRAIAANLPIGASRQDIDAFFAGQGLTPVYDPISYYGRFTPRYQAIIPDTDPGDAVDDTVVLHLFLNSESRLVASDVRYLFDLYR
jgi:hypothetical protein